MNASPTRFALRSLVLAANTLLLLNAQQHTFAANQPPTSQPPKLTSSSSNQFGFELYRQIVGSLSQFRTGSDGNLAFSPYCLTISLAAMRQGITGQAAQEIDKALHKADDIPGASELTTPATLNTGEKGDLSLAIANGIWVDQQYKLKPKFQNAAQAILNGQVANTDFRSGDKAATSLNEWVSVATNKQIPNLFVPGDFKTPSVLVGNALALKGVWEQSFDPAQTKPGPFRLTSGKTIQTPLMHSTANYRFADLGWVKVLEIPYQGGTLGLDLLLPPPKPDAMSKLERSVKELWFHDLTSHFSDRKLAVAIPKFEINCDLGETIAMLRAMGIQRVFNPAPTVSAEMAEIAEKPVLVSTWQHKTRITVDEKGTEALAAVAEAPNSSSTSIKPTEFIADHPFMFVVRHIPSNTVLFMGRLSKP